MRFENNEIVEKIVNFLLNILIFIFSVFLLVAVYTGFQTRIIGNDYPDFFGYSFFEVQTGSMKDTINPGDWIVVKLTSDVKLDDVVTYELNGNLITHRLIEVYKGTFVTQGDANSDKDAPIDQNQVIGKVVKVLAGFGVFRKILLNPAVLLTLIIALFFFSSAYKNNKFSINDIIEKAKEIFNKIKKSKISEIPIISKIFNRDTNYKNDDSFFSSLNKDNSFYETKEYEKLEDELSKTALYRMVSVNSDDVKEDFKILTPKNKTEEEIEEILDKTALHRIVSVDVKDVDKKYQSVDAKVEDEEKQPSQAITKTEKYAEIEDELGKTSIFRVISVDAEEVKKEKPLPTNEEEQQQKEADLEKTSHFRFITVDQDEVDNTLLEIAENEMNNPKPKEEVKEEVTEKIEENEELEDESLTSINLDLLKSKSGRKGKNIIDKILVIKKEEIDDLIEIIVKDDATYTYRAAIKNKLSTVYTDAKYYNYYGTIEIESRGRNLTSKVKKMITVISEKLKKEYNGKDNKYTDIIEKYVEIFSLIADLEQARDSVSDKNAKKEFYKKALMKYYKDWDASDVEKISDEIIKVQDRYLETSKFFLEKLKTDIFDIKFNKITGAKDMFGIEVEHNLTFNKVYSDYIIDKTYNEGLVAEDKIPVLLSLLSVQIVNDLLSSTFDKQYVFYIPSSVYTKSRKFSSLLKIIDNEYAKSNVVILVTYEMLLQHKQVIKEYRKAGYKFGLTLDKDDVLLKKNQSSLYLANCIFFNKRDSSMADILSVIPEDLTNKIISDNVTDKVGDVGSE